MAAGKYYVRCSASTQTAVFTDEAATTTDHASALCTAFEEVFTDLGPGTTPTITVIDTVVADGFNVDVTAASNDEIRGIAQSTGTASNVASETAFWAATPSVYVMVSRDKITKHCCSRPCLSACSHLSPNT
jgi:hypothetical protein